MSSPTIVCVDDEYSVLLELRTQLRQCFPNYAIAIAESGAEAITLVEKLLADGLEVPLVIVDQLVPDMSGEQVLIELHGRHPEILKIMLTSQASAEDVSNLIDRVNLYRFLPKPWNAIDLQLTVTEALRRYQQDRQLSTQKLELEQAKRELERLHTSLEQQIQEHTQQLRQNEKQLRLFFEHTPVGVAMFDRQMNYLIASQRWLQDYQLESSVIGKCHYDVFPNAPDYWREVHQRCLQGNVERNEKEQYILADGTEAWVRWEVRPWYDDTDSIGGLIIFGELISDRIRAEIALRQSEAKQSALINTLPDLIMRVNREGMYLDFIVPTTFPLLGDAQELIGTKVEDTLPPDLAAKRMKAVHDALQTREMQIYEQELCIDGVLQTEECRVVAYGEDDVMIVGRDISDRKLIEQALKKSEEIAKEREQQLSSLLNNIPHIAWLKDRDGRFLAVNEPFAQACGYASSQLIGLTDLDIWSHELAETYIRDDREVIDSGKQKQFEEYLLIADGTYRWIETIKSPVVNDVNESIGTAGIAMDITDRKQAKENLQKLNEELEHRVQERTQELSQARNFLEAIIENIPLALFVKNGKEAKFGEFVLWNNTCERMFGCSKEQAIGKSVYDFFPKEQSDFFNEKDRLSFALGRPEDIPEEPIDSLTLGRRILHTVKVPIFDEYGNPDYLICISDDITDRKQAEIALQESNERFRATFEQAATGIAQNSLDGKYIRINQKYCDIMGYSEAELLLMSFVDITHPEDLEKDNENTRLLFSGELQTFTIEKRYIRKDGEIVWANLAVSLVRDSLGEPQYVIGVVQDISDRKRSERQLQSESLRLQLALESSEMGTWESNLDTGIWSARTEAIFGYEAGTFPGDREAFLKLVYLEDQERVFQALSHSFTTQSPYNIEYRINRNDGEMRWVAVNGKVVEIEDGAGLRMVGVARDITDRKQAEIILRQYQRMVEIAPDGMALVDRNYTYRLVNQTYLEHNEWQLEETVGRSIPEIMGEHTFQTIVKSRFDRCLAGETIDYGEWFYFKKAGNRFVNVTYSPYFEIDGTTIIGVVIINREVTERRKAELLLQDSEERLRLALTAANQGLYDLNPQTGITIVSPEYATILGYSPDEFEETNAKWIERLHPDDLEPVASTYQAYVKGEISNYKVEFRQRTKDNQWKWILSIGKIVEWDNAGQPLRMLGTHTDISDRKQAELDLQESQRFLQTVIDTFPLAVFWKDRQSVFLGCNLKTAQAAGLNSPIEIIGKTDYDLPWSLEETEIYRADDREVMESNQAKLGVIETQKLANGTTIWIETNKLPLYNLNDEVIGVLGTYQDISDRKRAELERDQLLQELSQLNSELEQANHQLEEYSLTLEQRVEERTNELQNAQERIMAQEKLASLGTLTAGIAHELRNPLNFVKNYAEGSIELTQELLETLQPIFSSQALQTASLIETLIIDLQENASTIHRHSLRAADIISSMMEHARSEPASMQPTALNNLLNEAMRLACHAKQSQNINFNVDSLTDYDPEVHLVDVIPNTLMRALINLIDNACDAMRFKQAQFHKDEGSTSTYTPRLRVSTQLVGETVEICIRDNGCGISPQIQSKILDPFFTTKPPGSGTGLGLSLTHDIIVKQHQGSLAINSQLNEFTEILITIPLHSPNLKSW
ncbi:hypothetical protein B9G53_16795 [Pseudanabaena sp. SR411]|uniref:PAS domain S-box protein n=1 Tax=Pseudanabaena sp. SR411 TaxID=1980935 RepID=UPI000B99BB5C|nr:PAS domain S-box protein [Pseudanabaena sp. SR411]OYQ63476.1 hypothetical protein B9G53_16795 [Pseudanabaena sp. SR411]